MLDSFLPKKKEGLAGQVEGDDCWLWVNPVPVRCLVVRQKTTAAAEDNQRQQAAETWAQLLAQQYSLIIPRGSTAEMHKHRSCSLATVKKTEWWGERLTPSVLIVFVQLAVERIIHNSYSCPESANQSNFPELGEANSSDALRTLSNCVNACVHVFPGITADQSKSFKGGERGSECDGANGQQGWMQRGWNAQRKDTGYGCTGVRMRVQNEKGWGGEETSYLENEKSSGPQWWWMCCRPRHRFQSQLPGQTERLGERKAERGRERRHVTLPLSISILMPSTFHAPFHKLPVAVSARHYLLSSQHFLLIIRLSLSTVRTHTSESSLLENGREKEGRKRWDLGEQKEGKGSEGWRETATRDLQPAASWRKRTEGKQSVG